jgi:multidrug resistance efflux pump
MAIKFRKLHETATLEAGATMPRAFNYKIAFLIFIICLIGLAVLIYGAVTLLTMNRLSTTYAEAVPSNETEIRAQTQALINKMYVSYGDTVKEGDILFEVEPLATTADQAAIEKAKAELTLQERTLDLLRSGADIGIATLNDVPRRFAAAQAALELAQADLAVEEQNLKSVMEKVAAETSGKQRELEEVTLRRDQAKAACDVAQGNFTNAESYFNDHIITFDKYKAAQDELNRRKLDIDAAEKIIAQVTKAVEDIKREGEATINAQKSLVEKAKVVVSVREKELAAVKGEYESFAASGASEQPDLKEAEKARVEAAQKGREFMIKVQEAKIDAARAAFDEIQRTKGTCEYRAPFTGKVGWIQAREGDTVGPNDFVMKLFRTEGMEVQARFPQDSAGKIAKGQEVDVKLHTENGYVHIKGKVEAITNQFYTLPPQDRARVRIENPGVEMNLVVVRISLEGKEKEALYPGDPVTVTIYTNK